MDAERLVENETALGFDGRDLLAEIERLTGLAREPRLRSRRGRWQVRMRRKDFVKPLTDARKLLQFRVRGFRVGAFSPLRPKAW